HEGVKHRIVKLAAHDAGLIDCIANLLLIMPTLSVFSREIEPHDRLLLTRPSHRKECRNKGIELKIELANFPRGELHELGDQRRAEATGCFHPVCIKLIEKLHQFFVTVDRAKTLAEVSITKHGDAAQVGIEQMNHNILYGPETT